MEEVFKISWLGISGISILTFLIGLIAGHRLNIYRDKRNRLFELSKDLRDFYVKQAKDPNTNSEYKIDRVLDNYISYKSGLNMFYSYKAKRLEKLCAEFNTIQKTAYGKLPLYDPDSPIRFTIDEVDKFELKKKANQIIKMLND